MILNSYIHKINKPEGGKMKKVVTFAAVFFVAALIFISPAISATVGLRAVDPNIVNGQGVIEVPVLSTFQVELYFQGLTSLNLGDNGLVSATLAIDWDPLVAFQGWTKSSVWPNADVSPAPGPNVVPTSLSLNLFNFGTPVSADHVIGTFLLQCLGEGPTSLNPRGAFASDINFALADFNYLTGVTFQDVSINQVNPVPIPAAVWLLGSGVVGLVALKRRKKV
jgi:hypothetical protein